jgi:hypothetical protein
VECQTTAIIQKFPLAERMLSQIVCLIKVKYEALSLQDSVDQNSVRIIKWGGGGGEVPRSKDDVEITKNAKN